MTVSVIHASGVVILAQIKMRDITSELAVKHNVLIYGYEIYTKYCSVKVKNMHTNENLNIIKNKKSMNDKPIEIVERKGLGHPDTICDSIMNQMSIDLSNEYIKKFGTILHHNLDKALLSAGQTTPTFGGGSRIKPMRMIFGDRATYRVENEDVDVFDMAKKTATRWFHDNIPLINTDDIIYDNAIESGSIALQDIFERKAKYLGANDTSATVGYAPLSILENFVLSLEYYLNTKKFKKSYPQSGQDIKIMAYRNGNLLDLTVSVAMVSSEIESEKEYFAYTAEIKDIIEKYIKEKSPYLINKIRFNALDKPNRGEAGCYLTLSGTSAESGDSGQVGRGNNPKGIIPLFRPSSAEALAGKNPISHVGKIYNSWGFYLANKIVEYTGVDQAYVWLLSTIGSPVNEPASIAVEVSTRLPNTFKINKAIEQLIAYEIENLDKYMKDLQVGTIHEYY